MAPGFVFSIFILNNTLFIQVVHKSEFIIFAVKISHKGRTGKYFETLLDTIGVAQASIANLPNINLLAHNATSNQYPTNKYSCTEFRCVFASLWFPKEYL